jgi:DNA-directed RNA polymerase specialized sigma24 family protein
MSAPADKADRGTTVARWYADCGPRLYRYAIMLLADRTDAEDVLQQVFAAVIANRRTDPARPEAYLRTAVRNAAYSLLRQRRTARATGESINTVAGRYRYALARLRETLT